MPESNEKIDQPVAVAAESPREFRAHRVLVELQDRLRSAVTSTSQKAELLRTFAKLAMRHQPIVAAAWYALDEHQTWRLGVHELDSIAFDDARVRKTLDDAVAASGTSGAGRIYPVDAIRNLSIVAHPVPMPDGQTDVLTLLVANESDGATEIVIAELLAAYVTVWCGRGEVERLAWELQSTAVVLELVGKVSEHETVSDACSVIANELREHLNCNFVAVGIRRNTACEVRAISSVAEIHASSSGGNSFQKACEEVLDHQESICWPPDKNVSQGGSHAHRKLASELHVESAVGLPLRDADGEIVGSVIICGSRALVADERIQCLVTALEEPLGGAVAVSRKLEGGRWHQLCRAVSPAVHPARSVLLGTSLLLIAGLLLTPFPYRIGCRCNVEPVLRRFAVAPHDGLVESTFVEPGDLVKKGQLLARMDGREIRWELAGVTADTHRAQKKRDSHMAHHEIPDSVMAGLEVKRLETKTELLEFRESNLQLSSPIDGIVLSGSLDRRENYPVKLGEPLYEIAPIDRMRIELQVRAGEVHHVRRGQRVDIRIEGLTGPPFSGIVSRVHPRSEVRERDNVFIADVVLKNGDRVLRPGMEGSASIIAAKHPLAWNLFHTAWEKIIVGLGR